MEKYLGNKQAEKVLCFNMSEEEGGGNFQFYQNPGYITRGLIFFLADEKTYNAICEIAFGLYKSGFHIGILIIPRDITKQLNTNIDFIINKIQVSGNEYFIAKERIILFVYDELIEPVFEILDHKYQSFFIGVVLCFLGKKNIFIRGFSFQHNYVCALSEAASGAIAYCKNAYAHGYKYEIHIYNDPKDMNIPKKGTTPGWWDSLNFWLRAHGWC
jgi:hypothetical protein